MPCWPHPLVTTSSAVGAETQLRGELRTERGAPESSLEPPLRTEEARGALRRCSAWRKAGESRLPPPASPAIKSALCQGAADWRRGSGSCRGSRGETPQCGPGRAQSPATPPPSDPRTLPAACPFQSSAKCTDRGGSFPPLLPESKRDFPVQLSSDHERECHTTQSHVPPECQARGSPPPPSSQKERREG